MSGSPAEEEDQYDTAFRVLLTRAYTAPESRPGFRSDLLKSLKMRQRALVARRRRRRQTVTYLFTSTAAAAVFFLALLPAVQPETTAPGGTASPTGLAAGTTEPARISSTPVRAPQPERASTHSPFQTVAMRDAPVSRRPKEFPSVSGRGIDAYGDIEMRLAGGDWISATPELLALHDGAEYRVAPGAQESAVLRIDRTADIVLSQGAVVRAARGALQLVCGDALVVTGERTRPLNMMLLDQALALEPGTSACLRVRSGPEYATGGEPAPAVMLTRGRASALGDYGTATLAANRLYRMYPYATDSIPGRPLSEQDRRQAERMNDLRLVSYSRGN